jgi:hypothetical protein
VEFFFATRRYCLSKNGNCLFIPQWAVVCDRRGARAFGIKAQGAMTTNVKLEWVKLRPFSKMIKEKGWHGRIHH